MGINIDNKGGNLSASNGLKINDQKFPETAGSNKQILTTNGSDTLEWSSLSISNCVYVASDGSDTTGDGSINLPFATVQAGIDNATNGGTIHVFPGTYVESPNVSREVNITSAGGNVTIFGKTTITADNVNVNDIMLKNTATTALEIVGATGFKMFGGSVERSASTDIAIQQSGVVFGENIFIGTNITGVVDAASQGTGALRLSGISSPNTVMRSSHADVTLAVDNSPRIGTVEHTLGRMVLRNIGSMGVSGTGKSIVSAATTGSGTLFIENVNLQQEDFTVGIIDKVGDCSYALRGTNYDVENSVLNGTRNAFDASSDQMLVTTTPTNYTPSGDDLSSHLDAINTALAPTDEIIIGLTDIIYVETAGDDTTGNGSMTKPYATLGKALTSMTAGDIIVVAPGTYNEDITVTASGVSIFAHGIKGSQSVTIHGNVYLNSVLNATFSGIRFYNDTDEALSIVSGSGHKFFGCSLERSDAVSTVASVTGNINGQIDFLSSTISGEFVSAGNGGIVNFDGTSGDTFQIRTQTEFSTTNISNATAIAQVEHTDGILVLRNVGKIHKDASGNSVVSTAGVPASGTNFLNMINVDLVQEDYTYGKITKTGGCQYALTDVNRNSAFDNITGSRLNFGRTAEDIAAGVSPSNYSPSGDSIKDHLEAIDTSLASGGSGGAGNVALENVVYVAKNGSDSNEGNLSDPFLTVNAAVNSITDASANNRYIISIAPGTYDEVNTFTFKPFVNIHGQSPETTIIQREDGVGGYQNQSLPVGDVSCRIEIRDVSFGTNGGFDVTHTSPSGNVMIAEFNNVLVGSGGMSLSGMGAGRDSIIFKNHTEVLGDVDVGGFDVSVTDTTFAGTLTATNGTGTYTNGTGAVTNVAMFGSKLNNVSVGDSAVVSIASSPIIGTLAATETAIVNLDAASTNENQASITIAATATLNKTTQAHAIEYAANAYWGFASAVPNDVKDALDELAIGMSSAASSVDAAGVIFVATNGDDALGDGTVKNPYETISKAVAVAANDSAIIIAPGTYSEDVTINGKTGLYVKANGKVTVNGRFLLSGSTNDCTFEGIDFVNTAVNTVWVDNTTDLKFINSSINRTEGYLETAIYITSTSAAGKIEFINTDVGAKAEMLGDQEVRFSGLNNSNANFVTAKESATTIIEDSPVVGYIQHNAGRVRVRNVGRMVKNLAGYSIVSTPNVGASNGNQIVLENVSLVQADGTYGRINKTGLCTYVVTDVDRDPVNDVLTGTRIRYGRSAYDTKGDYTPSNYSASVDSLRQHLVGIDNAIGTLSGGNTGVNVNDTYYVDGVIGNNANTGAAHDPFKTIQHALTAIGDIVNVSGQNKEFTINIAPGLYNENLSVPVGRSIVLKGMGSWVLGDAIVPTVTRNITVSTDGALVGSGDKIPELTVVDGLVSGDLNISTGSTSSFAKISLKNSRLNGTINSSQTADVFLNFENSSVNGAINVTAGILETAIGSTFAALTIKEYRHVTNTKFTGNVTVTAIGTAGDLPNGMYDTQIGGIFTGPANSFIIDGTTDKFFTDAGGLLGGSASKVLNALAPEADSVIVAATPSNYDALSTDVEAHLAGIDDVLNGESIGSSHTPTNYTSAGTTLTEHLAGIDTALASSGSGGSVSITNTVHVSNNGSDTNDGSFGSPFLTIEAAMNSITAANDVNQYVISLEPGYYSEADTFVLKPNVSIVGPSSDHVRVERSDGAGGAAPLALNIDTSTVNKSFYRGVSFGNSGLTVIHAAGSTNAMMIGLDDIRTDGPITITGVGAGIDSVYLHNVRASIAPTLSAVNGTIFGNYLTFGLSVDDNGGVQTNSGGAVTSIWVFSTLIEELNVTSTTNPVDIFLRGSDVVTLTADGADASIYTDNSSKPDAVDTTLTNNATLSVDKTARVADDTAPELGGNLDVAGHSIVSTNNGDIILQPHGTGQVIIGGSTSGELKADDATDVNIVGGDGIGGNAGDAVISGGDGDGIFTSGDVILRGGSGGASDGNVVIDLTTGSFVVSGIEQLDKVTMNLADSVTDGTIFTFNSSAYKSMFVDVEAQRIGGGVAVGTLMIATDGTNVTMTDTLAEAGVTGVTFSASIATGTVSVTYTTTATGTAGTLKYTIRRWV